MIALSIALAGCENLAERGRFLTGPEAFLWESDSRFHVVGEEAMWGQANVFDEDLSFFVRGFPPGTTVRAGNATAAADGDGVASVRTNITALLGSIPTESLEEARLDHAHVTVQAPGREPIEVPLRPLAVHAISEILLRSADGPVLFEGETEQDAPARNAIWFPAILRHSLVGAPAATLRDLDAVATITRTETGVRTCTGYVDDQDRPQPDVRVHLKSTTVALYARRSGRRLGTITLPAIDECPEWLTEEVGRQAERDSVLPDEAIEQWLASQLRPAQ